jgi:uncharacterized damage-inducible protein DinB
MKRLMIEPVPDCHPMIGSWLGAIEDCRSLTQLCLEGVSAGALDWSYSCSPHTIGTLLYHIAAIEADWLLVEVLESGFPPEVEALFPYEVRDSRGMLTIVRDVSLPDHWERLNVVRNYLLDSFQIMTLEDFHRERILPEYTVTPEWVLHHLCQHEAEHRSEIAILRSRFEAKEEVTG